MFSLKVGAVEVVAAEHLDRVQVVVFLVPEEECQAVLPVVLLPDPEVVPVVLRVVRPREASRPLSVPPLASSSFS